jgi:hypothetical protein
MSIKEELLKLGFLTGSRAFGTAGVGSDWDIVISVTELQKVAQIIDGKTIKESDYFKGFYVEEGGEEINIIPVHPDEYLPWYLTTKAVSAILQEASFEKSQKYALFNGIRALLAMSSLKLREEELEEIDTAEIFS